MTNPLIGRTTTPAEREAGCFLSYSFKNNQDVVLDGGTIAGTPTIDNGLELNGTTDYVTYGLTNEFRYDAAISMQCVFYPNFEADDGSAYRIAESLPIQQYGIFKAGSNSLAAYLGGNTYSVVYALYGPYWRIGQRNVITVHGESGNVEIYFNGYSFSAGAAAWTPQTVTLLAVGARNTPDYYFDGKIELLQFYDTLLDFEDHKNLFGSF